MAVKKQDIFAHPIRKYQTLLTKTKEFFNAEKEMEYQPIVIFVFLYILVGQILEFVAWVPSLGVVGAEAFPAAFVALPLSIFGILIGAVIMLLLTFLIAGVVHLGISYYKKGAPYFLTWKVVAYATLISIIYNVFSSILTTLLEAVNPWPEQSIYAQVPIFGPYYIIILALMFIIGIAALVHTIYTEIVGIKIYHKLSTKQAAVAVIVPMLILILLITLFVVCILLLMGATTLLL